MIKFKTSDDFSKYIDQAYNAFDTLEEGTGPGNNFLGWLNLPSSIQDSLVDEYYTLVNEWKKKKIEIVLVIGIGGSYLGAKAAIEAVRHSFEDSLYPNERKVVFAGFNLSEDYMAEVLDLVRERSFSIIMISKSGTTTEPAIAFRIFKQLIEKRYGEKEAASRIVAITDKSRGVLKTLADEYGYQSFVIDDDIGGRFSVLSPVGLLPIAMAGLDVREMINGARRMEELLSERSEMNPAICYAAWRNMQYEQGKKIEILVNYNPKLHYVAEWWKQLYGESEGKQGKGLFPASVSNTTDLHSMGQYIQDGERILIETTLAVSRVERSVVIEGGDDNSDGLDFIAGKHVEECNSMAQAGTMLAHLDGGVPNSVITIGRLDEYHIGALFYFFEKACGISAYMLGVNPFDQPGVEEYKKNMFALLGKPGYEKEQQELKKRLQ